MTYIYGTPSQYTYRRIKLSQLFQSIFIFIAGFVSGTFVTSVGKQTILTGPSIIGGLIALFILLAPFLWWTRREYTLFSKEENSFRRGSKGESKVYHQLRKLPSYFTVRQNLNLEKVGNIDFVMMGKYQIFAIEVKAHSGKVTFNNNQLLLNGKPFEKDIMKQAKAEAFAVSEYMKENDGADVWVEPVIVFSNNVELHFGTNKVDGVYVIGLTWLNELLQEKDIGDNELPQTIKSLQRLVR